MAFVNPSEYVYHGCDDGRMDIYDLQDKLGDELCDAAADSFDAVLLAAYNLGKNDGAREALDVSQYVTSESEETDDYDDGCGDETCTYCYPPAEPEDEPDDFGCGDYECEICYPQPAEPEHALCPCGCGLTQYEIDAAPEADDELLAALDEIASAPEDELFLQWSPDTEFDEEVYIVFADGVEVPLSTVVELLVDDLIDLDATLTEAMERIEYLEYEVGIKRINSD